MTTVQVNRNRYVLPDAVAFWGLAGLLAWLMVTAVAPTPLYQVYAARWHFSPLTSTILFAIYAVGLLATLLFFGRLSDHLGRRPVILTSLAVDAAAQVAFLIAKSTVDLAVARVLVGLAIGTAIAAVSAAQAELSDSVAPGLGPAVSSGSTSVGLGFGAALSCVLVQYGPAPLRLIYWVALAGLLVGIALIVLMRETTQSSPGAVASLKPTLRVSPSARGTFLKAAPTIIAFWALSGFYLSLIPGVASSVEGSPNRLWGGGAILALYSSGALAVIVRRSALARSSMLIGCVGVFLGMGLSVVAIATSAYGLFIVGSVIGGVGFGLAFVGSFRTISEVTPPRERAGTIAVMYVLAYSAFSIPIVLAGLAAQHWSLHYVGLGFCAGVSVLGGIGALLWLQRGPALHSQTLWSQALPGCPGTPPPYLPPERPVANRPAGRRPDRTGTAAAPQDVQRTDRCAVQHKQSDDSCN